ncbi:MAG: hypothetical protein LBI70_01105 [Rickettsiales bacterium]|jgi:hypothetical protein|nr:hypothetical protein [Rickettsiales bacterium]
MDKFFRFINVILNKKYLKILLMLVAGVILLYSVVKPNTKLIDKRKLNSVLEGTKKRFKIFKIGEKFDKQKIDKQKIPPDKEERVKETPVQEVALKKQLKPDIERQKKENITEKKIDSAISIFLKVKTLEKSYSERKKKGEIDHRKIAREGDIVYYSMEVSVDGAGENQSQTNHRFFMKIVKNDPIARKLLGKKVGQTIEYSYSDLLENLDKKNKKNLEDTLNQAMQKANKLSPGQNLKILNNLNIKYRITLLDFIPRKIIRELALDQPKIN